MSTRDAESQSFLNSGLIDEEFLADIIESKLKIARDEFKIRLVYITPATGKGDNYASVVYRARVYVEILKNNERTTVDVVIKALISTLEKLRELEIFKREIVVYKEVIDNFEEIFYEKTKEKIEFGPKCLKIVYEPCEIIVLDDLKPEGFKMADRKIGLDLKHSKIVLSKLAKFHAASALQYQKNGKISEHLDRFSLMKNEKISSAEEFKKTSESFRAVHLQFIETIKSIGGSDEIVEKIQQWDQLKMLLLFMAMAEPMQNGLQVLNHGDDWVNNFMFKYDDDGNVIDVKFIDFQLSYWGSPANDIIYFLVSSVKDGIKIEYFDDLIKHYHVELVGSLKKLEYNLPIPTLHELHVDLLLKGGGFPFHAMLVMMVVKYNSEQEFDVSQVFDSSSRKSGTIDQAFNNPIYKKALAEWLPFLDKRGYLDCFLPNASYTPFMQAIIDQMPKPDDQNGN